MHIQPVVQYASRTDVGMRRSANQDSLAVRLCNEFEDWQNRGHLFVVADGMGGHSVGDLASRITVETLPQTFFRVDAETVVDRIRMSVAAANKAVNDRGQQNPEFADMGTTCSALSLSEHGAVIGHIGDSRVYRIRRNVIAQMTFDHSLQWEMIRLGRATTANVDLFHPRNVITRCIGPDPNVKIDVEGPFSVLSGDRWVLCSDGLSNHLADEEIGQIAAALPPVDAAQLLVDLANCRGGSDNSTAIVIDIESYPSIVGSVVDSDDPPESKISDTKEMPAQSATIWIATTRVLTIIGIIMGAGLLTQQQPWNLMGVVLLVIPPAVWLIRRIVGNLSRRNSELPVRPPAMKRTGRFLDMAASDPNGINRVSPYRYASAERTESLLDNLAEIQSELVQATRDNGWAVNLEKLTTLNRQSVAAQQTAKLDRALQHRGQAIELLMKEFYQQTRSQKR